MKVQVSGKVVEVADLLGLREEPDAIQCDYCGKWLPYAFYGEWDVDAKNKVRCRKCRK